jgi:hypothetical protein
LEKQEGCVNNETNQPESVVKEATPQWIQCPYMIKDALGISWLNCQLEIGHPSTFEHKPPPPQRGTQHMFEGIWHKPGEKSTADPEPSRAFTGFNAISSEEKHHHPINSRKE